MNNRISQAYGYAVCFITVIVMLIGIKQVVDAAFDLSDPIRANGGGYGVMGRQITSFELYKAEAKREPPNTRGTPYGPDAPAVRGNEPVTSRAAADTLSDAELRRLYDAERENVIANTRFRAIRSLVGNILLIVVAAVLFVIHWRWLKRRDTAPVAVYSAGITPLNEPTDTR
jgi:hypothetical protein